MKSDEEILDVVREIRWYLKWVFQGVVYCVILLTMHFILG